MSTPKFRYDKITLDTTGVILDGVTIDGMCIAHGVTMDHGGRSTQRSITLTIYGAEIEITDALKAFAKEHGTPIIEIHGDAEHRDVFPHTVTPVEESTVA